MQQVQSDVSETPVKKLINGLYWLSFQVLLEHKEISGEEIDFILNKYPPQTPVKLLFEEENPGSLQFMKQEQKRELEYALLTQQKGETL